MLPADAVRVFWVNPVADLRVMNLLEDVGGRVCGTDYMFCHALDRIPTDLPPLEALARMAPGRSDGRFGRGPGASGSAAEVRRFGAEAVVISRIPGASHCAMEGAMIGEVIRTQIDVPVVEIEVPPVTDAMEPTLRTRLEALVETVRAGQGRKVDSRFGSRDSGQRGAEAAATKSLNRADPQMPPLRQRTTDRSTTMICAGIDAGSRTTKVVLLDGDGRDVVASGVVDQGIEQDALAESLLDRLLQRKRHRPQPARPGRGHRLRPQADPRGRRHHHRNHLPGLGRAPQPARGADHHRHRRTRQQALAAACRRHGRRLRDERPLRRGHGPFPGTVGRPAGRAIGRASANWPASSRNPAVISSMCVVFAETEIIGLLASGVTPADIVAGVRGVAGHARGGHDRPQRRRRRSC